MRVAIDARVATDHFPGIGRVAIRLTEALARRLEPAALWALTPPPGVRARAGAPAGRAIPCAASPFSIAQQWAIPRALRAAGIDVYHSLYVGMPAFPGVPTVWTCHDLIPLLVPGAMDPVRRTAVVLLHRLAARAATRITVGSSASKRDLVERLGIAESRVAVVPWGVDPRFFSPSLRLPEERVAQLDLPPRYFLYVGINKPHKNLPRLVRALARAQAARPERDLRLVVAGPWDPRYPEARTEAEQPDLAGRVRFTGPVGEDELPALFAGATGFVFPSAYEGFGLPVLEALACGTPTITSNASSLPEVAGDAALLVPPDDENALAEAIGRLADDAGLREELARRGRERAAQFTWDRTADAMIRIYREAADAARGARARGIGRA